MKTITATAARKRFGALLKAVRHEPILISRKNRDATVIMSAEEYARIRGVRNALLQFLNFETPSGRR